MKPNTKLTRFLIWLGVALLQMLMTQVVTFIFSLIVPQFEGLLESQRILFVIVVGLTFSIGVFLTGWLALHWNWLKGAPRYPARLIGTLAGAYLPLVAALALDKFEAGTPFFLISVLASIFGFHLPGWVARKQ